MEKPLSSQNEPEAVFFCHLCSVSCASALNLQSHFLGVKHRKAEEALRNNKTDKEEPIEVKPNATLQEQIDACKNWEPAVGLEYIYQYHKHGYNTYECKLCECRAGLTNMFMHIIGAKHRIYYLGKHHPSLGISGPYIMKGPKKLKKLRDICLTVEKEFGRQKINVMEETESTWSATDVTGASSLYYTPDSELEQMDFTSDDFFKVDAKPAVSEHVVTFIELKAANEANQKKAASSNGSAHNTEEPEEIKQKDTDKKSRKETHEKEEHSKESCKSDQDFTNNKDLLDFLEHFRILEDGDAKFVNIVVEMLSISLMRYKKVCKENEENQSSVSQSDTMNKQDPVPSVVPPHANQGFNKTGLVSERKKLIFTLSSNKVQESVLKCNQKQESYGSTPSYNTMTNAFNQDKKEESVLKCNQKQESYGSTPSYSTMTNVFNQDEREDIPAHYNQKQKIPASQFNRKTSESHSSSSMMSALQNPVFSASQINRGAPFAQTKFAPPHAPFSLKAAPPLFPIAKNDIVNTFFESIKNMEVAEVISTLNKITTTNPAFKGIHVPSLVRYLTETGKLKSGQSTQQLNQ